MPNRCRGGSLAASAAPFDLKARAAAGLRNVVPPAPTPAEYSRHQSLADAEKAPAKSIERGNRSRARRSEPGRYCWRCRNWHNSPEVAALENRSGQALE